MPGDHDIILERDRIISEIRKYAPRLGAYFSKHESLADYSRSLYDYHIHPVYLERQLLIHQKLSIKFSALFGSQSAGTIENSTLHPLVLNIVDHHMVLNHPMLISGNIIANVVKLNQPAPVDPIIVISSGDVPPNNYFSKNGFMFRGQKVPLFSNSEKESCSYVLPQRSFNFVDRLQQQKRWNAFDQPERQFLESEQARLQAFDFSRCHDYTDQISTLVRGTWPLLFEQSLRPTIPELWYMTQEELATECLIDLLSQDNFITQTLFDEAFRKRVLDTFRGIVVTWREDEGKGTHFFWRKHPERPEALRMYVSGDELIPHDARYQHARVPLERDELIRLLKTREIFPSLFMIFAVLIYYCGVKPLVGHGSLLYLNQIKDVWLKTLQHSAFPDEASRISTIPIDGLIVGPILCYQQRGAGMQVQYAADLIADGGFTRAYLEKLFHIRLSDLIGTSAAGIYEYIAQKYIPIAERIPLHATPERLAQLVFAE